jgi:cytochrome c oxidase assembly protein subunit 15
MTELVSHPWSPPRWLRHWAAATVALLFALLLLGAVVTSFRVGMADPIWPTRPWHLAVINWQEQSRGFLIEHTHRLAGFTLGGAVTILAIGLWLTEQKPKLKWGGAAALVALLGAFGQLHGTLIKQQRLYNAAIDFAPPATPTPAVEPPTPNWPLAAGPTLAALAIVGAFSLAAMRRGSPGRGLRALAVLLLVSVMAQGLLGGLRVYLNALFGTDLATIHGVFSQFVLALAVAVLVGCTPRRAGDDRWRPSARTIRWIVITAVAVFAQVVTGAVLRHTTSPLGPRLHLLLAFAVVATTIVVGRQLADAPQSIRRLKIALHALVGVQVLLGIESWLLKFADGPAAAVLRRITETDAALRTAHTLIGYAIFAVAVGLALVVGRYRPVPTRSPKSDIRSPRQGPVEVVV